MHVCIPQVYLVPLESRRGHWITWDWIYRQLWTLIHNWVLGIELESSGRLTSVFNQWAISPAQVVVFIKRTNGSTVDIELHTETILFWISHHWFLPLHVWGLVSHNSHYINSPSDLFIISPASSSASQRANPQFSAAAPGFFRECYYATLLLFTSAHFSKGQEPCRKIAVLCKGPHVRKQGTFSVTEAFCQKSSGIGHSQSQVNPQVSKANLLNVIL